MLAAASQERNGFPSLFHLALQIVSANRELPEQLSQHLKSVISEALKIAENPNLIARDTLSESIQLALQVKLSAELKSAIQPVLTSIITPNAAKNILELEREIETAS